MTTVSSTGKGIHHENGVVEIYKWDNASRSKSSGASSHDPVDVTTDCFVIECECTDNKSYSLKLSFWEEVRMKAHTGKLPLLAIRFRDEKPTDLIVMSAHDHSEVMEELEAYRKEALEHGQ